MKMYLIILALFLFGCKTTTIPTAPIEHKPAKCGVACMDQNELDLDTLENGNISLNIQINFTFLGDDISATDASNEQIIVLKDAFGEHFNFSKGEIDSKPNFKFTLNELYKNYVDDGKLIQMTRDSFNHPNVINVFVLKTIPDSTNGNVLLGFTPIYTQGFEGYASSNPRMDQIFISYQGLERKTTLIHELGHYFSLAHPWQLTFNQQKNSGLGNEAAVCTNYMNYNCFIDQFTNEQLEQMYLFAKKYRPYLIVK